ncbi:C-C motif chemokine 26-like [Morone saxatilis]|uniref:C-C motif chemokine 26-like n=1 Tax=Morone saxatilis TaxID=34816 RepID=UPI0015E240E4|nr:C-C motif chemokine 26-like [Morone saxatilis]
MTPTGMLTVTTALLCIILSLIIPAPAARPRMGKACCMRYNRKPIPFERIKGYREQTTRENCRMEAIIFYTSKKNEICATRKDAWVRNILELLSSKLKKMSKPGSAAGETQKKSVNPTFNDGSGSFSSTTEAFQNITESFY